MRSHNSLLPIIPFSHINSATFLDSSAEELLPLNSIFITTTLHHPSAFNTVIISPYYISLLRPSSKWTPQLANLLLLAVLSKDLSQNSLPRTKHPPPSSNKQFLRVLPHGLIVSGTASKETTLSVSHGHDTCFFKSARRMS